MLGALGFRHRDMSNALLVDAKHSANGHPVVVFGPQTGYYTPQLSQALNILALEQDSTLQALLGEAIDDLMRKYGKHPFGER